MNIAMKARLVKILLIATALAPAVFLYRTWSVQKPIPITLRAASQQVQDQPVNPPARIEHQIKVLTKALQDNPDQTLVLLELAELELEGKRSQAAQLHLQEVLHRDPENPRAKLELGRVLYQLGDVRGAIDQTQEILKKHPSNPDALYNMGVIYGNLGNQERAVEYWKQLAALDPQSEDGKLAQQMMDRPHTRVHSE